MNQVLQKPGFLLISEPQCKFVQNEITIPAFAGYTAEGATTTQNHNYPYNLTSVPYDLEWEEDEELDSPDNPVVGTLFPDGTLRSFD